MIIPTIDLLGGKVVQLVQGREEDKALELPDPIAVLDRFAEFAEVQVIDLDAAMGRPGQPEIVRELCARKACRVGGGVRSSARALELLHQGARKVIVASAAFDERGVNAGFLRELTRVVPRQNVIVAVDSLGDRVAVHGWKKTLPFSPAEVLPQLEPSASEFLCTYIDAEGKLQGTDLDFFRKLRRATALPITAAGGISAEEEIRALEALGLNVALGMAIYRKFFPELFPPRK